MAKIDRADEQYVERFTSAAPRIIAALGWQFGAESQMVLAAKKILDGLEPQVAIYSYGNGEIEKTIELDEYDLNVINLLLFSNLSIFLIDMGGQYWFEFVPLEESNE